MIERFGAVSIVHSSHPGVRQAAAWRVRQQAGEYLVEKILNDGEMYACKLTFSETEEPGECPWILPHLRIVCEVETSRVQTMELRVMKQIDYAAMRLGPLVAMRRKQTVNRVFEAIETFQFENTRQKDFRSDFAGHLRGNDGYFRMTVVAELLRVGHQLFVELRAGEKEEKESSRHGG